MVPEACQMGLSQARSWDHSQHRSRGVQLDLTFEGDVEPAAGADQIVLLDGGRVRVVGSVIEPASRRLSELDHGR